MDTDRLTTFLAEKQCDFVLNTPHASPAGRVWERQIRTVRNVLNATLAHTPGRLTDSSLRTFLYEAAAIVNSRSLTTDNLNDPHSLESLTPNHLLTTPLLPPGQFVKADLYARNNDVKYSTYLNSSGADGNMSISRTLWSDKNGIHLKGTCK